MVNYSQALASVLLLLSLTTGALADGKKDVGKKSKKSKTLRGFEYPNSLVPPSQIWVEGFASRLHGNTIQKYETPIQVWQTWRIDQLMWNCIAAYHATALDSFTYARPMYGSNDPEHHTSEARALCIMHGMNVLIPELIPISADDIARFVAESGLDAERLSEDMAMDMYNGGDRTPRVIGSIVGYRAIEDMQTDGWNYKGTELPNGKTCVANCRPFADSIGYIPDNSPWELSNDEKWQPLIESDGLGFFYAQEHVTPHIGFNAKPVILSRTEMDNLSLPDPAYDYVEEVKLAIERLETLASDDFQKEVVPFMDNKINIAGGMIMRLRGKYNLSLEAQVFYHYGYTSVELDVVIASWKEKINHNKIRPTSLVQRMGDELVTSFAGVHPARDWVPLIRVMPHAEYPSGSGCICIGISQFIDTFLLAEYGDASIETTWDFGTIDSFTFMDMTEFYQTCGESRLWGGMHFTNSVPDSYSLCDGIGPRGYTDLMVRLLGTGTYSELNDSDKNKYCDATPTNDQLFCEGYY